MKSLIPWWEYSFRICHRIGRPPISTIGLGRMVVSSLRRVPNPPARITAFIDSPDQCDYCTTIFFVLGHRPSLGEQPPSNRLRDYSPPLINYGENRSDHKPNCPRIERLK